MTDHLKKRMCDLVDGVIKLRLLATLPDEFLAYISHMELTPTDANIAQLEQFYNELANHLQARADAYNAAQSQPQNRPAETQQLEKISVVNLFVN